MSLTILSLYGAEVSIHTNENWHEVTKTRFVDKKTNYVLLREDINDGQYGRCDLNLINFDHFDGIIISDYNKSFLTKEDIKEICSLHPLVMIDTKKEIGPWCECATFIKINNYELQKARKITSKLKEKLIVTLGPAGASHKNTIYPVPLVEIKDLSGARRYIRICADGKIPRNKFHRRCYNFCQRMRHESCSKVWS